MDNTIGEFARRKIKWALEMLSQDSNTKVHDLKIKAELDFIIDSIGEPIIKEQLEYLYNRKYGNSEIQDLKKRILDLENQIKQREDDTTED